MARPSTFTDEIASTICERISADESLVRICQSDEMPSTNTVYRWLQEKPEFRDNYTRARADQAHTVADMVKDLRVDLLAGTIDPNTANAMLSLIKWETGKRNPKAYGDKLTTELTGADGGPVKTEAVVDWSGVPSDAIQAVLDAVQKDAK